MRNAQENPNLATVSHADGQLCRNDYQPQVTNPMRLIQATNQAQPQTAAPAIAATQAKPLTTQEVIDKFLTAKTYSVSQATIKSYRATLRVFARHCPSLPTTPEEIEQYLSRYNSDTPTARGAYTAIRLMYNFAGGRLGVTNPMAQVVRPRFKPKTPDRLTAIQARALLDAIATDLERALVYCFLGLGLRLSEAQRLNLGDIGEDTILIHGKERVEPMPLLPEIRDALLKLTDGRQPDEAVFQGQRGRLSIDMIGGYIIKRLFIRAGINGVKQSPHTLRHSRGALTAAAGLDSLSSKRLLRHRSTAMTDLYSQLNFGELRAKEERYNPLRILAVPEHSERYTISPNELLPQLLDQLEALGQTATELKRALGSNGHKAGALSEIKRMLEQEIVK
ncbi:Tyrosine recombinase XerC [subsurface metagenome]